MRLIKNLHLIFLLTLFGAFASQSAWSKEDSCGWLDPGLTFADSAESCITDSTVFFNIDGLGGPRSSLRDAIRSHRNYALAVVKDPKLCPLATGISWDWGPSETPRKAIEFCEKKFSDEFKDRCQCEVLLDWGKTKLSATQFWEKVALLDKQHVAGGDPLGVGDKEKTLASVSTHSGNNANAESQAKLQEQAKREEEEERTRQAELAKQKALEEEQRRLALEKQRAEQTRLAEARRVQEALERQAALKRVEEQRQKDELERQRLAAAQQAKEREEQELRKREAQAVLEKQDKQRVAEVELAREKERVMRLQAELEVARLRAQLAESGLNQPIATPNTKPLLKKREKVALVIGNNAYQNIPDLQNAVADARSIADLLDRYGFRVQSNYDLNEKNFKRSLRQFQQSLKGGEEVVFYYAGHGVQIDGVNYLLPTDTGDQSARQIEDEGIPLQRVLTDFSEAKAEFSLAMVDACRDNPFSRFGREMISRGLAPTTASTGQMIIFSAGVGQQALDRLASNDREKNGLFTRVLLKKIQATNAPVHQIMREVRAEVARLARSVGHQQVPAIYDQAIGDFYFR